MLSRERGGNAGLSWFVAEARAFFDSLALFGGNSTCCASQRGELAALLLRKACPAGPAQLMCFGAFGCLRACPVLWSWWPWRHAAKCSIKSSGSEFHTILASTVTFFEGYCFQQKTEMLSLYQHCHSMAMLLCVSVMQQMWPRTCTKYCVLWHC